MYKDMGYVLKINDNFHGHGDMHYMAELILSYLYKHGKNISEINFSIVTYDQYKKSLTVCNTTKLEFSDDGVLYTSSSGESKKLD